MLPEPGLLLWLSLLGGWIAVDGTGAGQFMLSRPLVAAALAGWVAGDPVAGTMVGIVLEAFHLSVLPVGAARYPEGGPPAVVAGGAFALSTQLPSALLTVVVFALLWEWTSGLSVRALRQFNVRLAARAGEALVSTVERRHLTAVLVDFVRGVLLVAVGTAVLSALLLAVELGWGGGERVPQLVLTAAVVGLLASSVHIFPRRRALFVAGAAAGVLLLLARG